MLSDSNENPKHKDHKVHNMPIISTDQASEIAISGFVFLSAEPEHLSSFMDLTGYQLSDLKEQAATREFQTAILDHLLGDESLLLVFCSSRNIDPSQIAKARNILGGNSEHMTSI